MELRAVGATHPGGASAAPAAGHGGRGPAGVVAAVRLYSTVGRPSIPPENLLRALRLQVLYSVRSERLLMEQLEFGGVHRNLDLLTQKFTGP